VLERGFFDVLTTGWCGPNTCLREADSLRVYLLGQYGTDLSLRAKLIDSHCRDPYGRVDFVRFGLERGELRRDLEY